LLGIESRLRLSRRFVSVVESAVVKWSFGNGKRQSASSIQSQRSGFGAV
jgi:hypothetical protein